MQLDTFFADFFQYLNNSRLKPWAETLIPMLENKLVNNPHGDQERWLKALNSLPALTPEEINLDAGRVGADSNAIPENIKADLEQALRGLIPWRKGPYDLFGVHINTEWRSDWKWDRIGDKISPLENRTILDVGCGSGYHMWRMLGDGAKRVVGVDPSYLFLMQFQAIKKYCGPTASIDLIPVKMEDVTPNLEAFDTVFSMGVLYHRKSPIDHLYELKGALKQKGELVLETLVIEGQLGEVLMPEDRYAMMRNVWFIPSIPTMELWLRRAGFKDIRCIESNVTSIEEQRVTDWMQFQSLEDFLDPNDSSLTAEGYPAPMRATFVATK